jgi:hypothetical protein
LFPDSNVRNRFPRFNCGVGSCNFTGYSSMWLNDGKDYAWTDNLTLLRGKHTWKAGVYFNLDDKQQQPSWNDAGSFDFSSSTTRVFAGDTNNGLSNLLLGNYQSAAQANGRFYGSFRFIGLEGYVQDSWKIQKRLTLELGARYVYYGPTYTRGDLLQYYFDPLRYDPAKAVTIDTRNGLTKGSIVPGSGDPFNGMVQENAGGIPNGFGQHRKNQVSPRIGFSWAPTHDGKMSVRGGFGVFYERMRQNQNNFGGLANPPLTYTPTVYAGNIDQMNSSLVNSGVRFPVTAVAFNQDYFTPTTYSWSFGVQKQFKSKYSLDVAYVGNTAKHLQYVRDLNQVPLGTTTGTTILSQNNNVVEAIRPYKGYINVNYTDYGASSFYNALQTRFSRRFSKSFSMNANFTWSKVMDDVDSDTQAIDYYLDRHRERGPAGFDRKYVFSLDYVYQLPRLARSFLDNRAFRPILNGWQTSGITRMQTGLPLTIKSNGNAGTQGAGPRADYVPGTNLYPETQTRDEWFNPLAFGRPFDGQLGNTGKGILRGPGMMNFDLSVFKNTKVGEGKSLQFRFETFNALNHPQWYGVNTTVNGYNPGQPVTQASRGTAGQVTTTRDPRNVQMSMKFYW